MRVKTIILVSLSCVELSACGSINANNKTSDAVKAIPIPAEVSKAHRDAMLKCGVAGARQLPGTRGTKVSDYDCGSR